MKGELKKLSGRLVLLFFNRVIKEAPDSAVPSTGHPGLLPFLCSGQQNPTWLGSLVIRH